MNAYICRITMSAVGLLLVYGCSGGSSGSAEQSIPNAAHFDTSNTQNIFQLNDTGWTDCMVGTGVNNCDPATQLPQDGMYGRDFEAQSGTLLKSGGGVAGFDFQKLDANGAPLSDQFAAYTVSPWSCVYDNVTRLTWEINPEYGIQFYHSTYSWYDPDSGVNGGDSGTQDGGNCNITSCDTYSYVEFINASNLCDYNDWRIPSREELGSIVNIRDWIHDLNYFPYASPIYYWTANSYAEDPSFAWSLVGKFSVVRLKSESHAIRLVRGNY